MFRSIRTNTILYCRLWSETVLFYRKTLGLPVQFENDWFVEFQLSENAFVSVANASRTSIDDAGGQGITLSWQIENLDGAKSGLANVGVSTGDVKTKWGARRFFFHDPEGHRLELWQPIPSAEAE